MQAEKVKKQPNVFMQTEHFVILWAYTKPAKWAPGQRKYSLIEKANPLIVPSRIDKRLNAVRQIIRTEVTYRATAKPWRTTKQHMDRFNGAYRRNKRVLKELEDMIIKGEQMWPCHFLLKGFPLPPGAGERSAPLIST